MNIDPDDRIFLNITSDDDDDFFDEDILDQELLDNARPESEVWDAFIDANYGDSDDEYDDY